LDDQLTAQVTVELDALAVDVRRVLVAGVVGALALRRLRRVMGADSSSVSQRGSFNRVQVLARTGVQRAVNTGALIALNENGQLIDALEWLTTRDERVCPVCAPRDGKRYPLNTIERPPIHPQCRCTLVPRIRDDLLVEPVAPPRMTFAEWARALGVLALLARFLRP
jgi:SPP1 gp7 family putative phage head morphogenesis protein